MKRVLMILSALVLVFVSISAEAQQHEVLVDVSQYRGHSSTNTQGAIGGQLSFAVPVLGIWDIGGRYSYGNFPKLGTPGGNRTVKSLFARRWIGPNIFIGVTGDRVYGDATLWTKEADFLGGFAGFRFRNAEHSEEDRVWFSYEKEVRTDAVAPNETEIFGLGWSHDFGRLPGPLFIRGKVGYSYVRFLQVGEWWTSHDLQASIGIGLKGSE